MIVIGIVALPEGGGGRGGGSRPLEAALAGPRRRRRFTATTSSGYQACGTTGRERNGRSVPLLSLLSRTRRAELPLSPPGCPRTRRGGPRPRTLTRHALASHAPAWAEDGGATGKWALAPVPAILLALSTILSVVRS